MKTFLTILFLTIGLLSPGLAGQTDSTPPPAPQGPIPVDQENQRKAKAVLDQMIDALGGNAYLNIGEISQQGRSYSFHLGTPNSTGLVFWRFYKFPDKDRVEVTKKRDVAFINNGDKGYEITFKGTRRQDAKDLTDYLRSRHYSLDWVLRKWLYEPGVALFYEGATVAEQKNVQQVTIMNAKNEGVTLYVDSSTHLPVKKSFSWRDPTDKQRNVEEEVFDSYRMVQGVMTAFTVTRFYNGDMSRQRFLNSVSYNEDVADSLFEPSGPVQPQRK